MNLYKAYKIVNRHPKTRHSLTRTVESRNSGDKGAAAQACLPDLIFEEFQRNDV